MDDDVNDVDIMMVFDVDDDVNDVDMMMVL